jgi:hypothetical protein
LSAYRGTILFIITIIIVIAALVGLTWANYQYALQNPGGNDFLARWMGAKYWVMEGVSPYDERVSLASQNMIYGHPADISQGEDKNHFLSIRYIPCYFLPPLDPSSTRWRALCGQRW